MFKYCRIEDLINNIQNSIESKDIEKNRQESDIELESA